MADDVISKQTIAKEVKKMEDKKSPKIVIIGGGIAGISAAQQLLVAGLTDVILLEAKDRLGGRIETIQYGEFCEWLSTCLPFNTSVKMNCQKRHGLCRDFLEWGKFYISFDYFD